MSRPDPNDGQVIVIKDYNVNSDYPDDKEGDLLTPPTTFSSNSTSSSRLVILYVIGIFLAIVLLLAMGYLFKLNYKSWLPTRKHFCDLRDCFRQSNGKKRKFFQRNTRANFTIPVVVVSDENGQSLDPDCVDTEQCETGTNQQIFP